MLLRGFGVKFSEQSLFNKIAHSCAGFADATTKGSAWYKLHTLALFTTGPRFNNIIHIMRIIYQSIKISNFYWCVNVGVTYYSESFPRLRSLKLGSLRETILTPKCLVVVLLNTLIKDQLCVFVIFKILASWDWLRDWC